MFNNGFNILNNQIRTRTWTNQVLWNWLRSKHWWRRKGLRFSLKILWAPQSWPISNYILTRCWLGWKPMKTLWSVTLTSLKLKPFRICSHPRKVSSKALPEEMGATPRVGHPWRKLNSSRAPQLRQSTNLGKILSSWALARQLARLLAILQA